MGAGTRNQLRRGFTLIEILIVVAILGILAVLVVPRFSSATEDAQDTAIRSQLRRIRMQIELYRSQNAGADPDLVTNQWADMTGGGYFRSPPRNTINGSDLIAASAGANVGWVWRDKGNGTMQIYATDNTFIAEVVEN